MVSKTVVIFSSSKENSQVQYLTKELENLNFSSIVLRNVPSLLASPIELENCLKEFDATMILGGIGGVFENRIGKNLSTLFNENVVVNENLSALCTANNISSSGCMLKSATLLKSTSDQEYPVVYIQGLFLLVEDLSLLKQAFEFVLRPFLSNLNRAVCFENDVVDEIYSSTYDHIRKSIEVIEECFEKYEPQSVFMSFNGGKDCTVLLHLVLAVLKAKYPNCDKLFCIYIEYENSFPELNKFIGQCKRHYSIEVVSLSKSIKESLALVLSEKPHMRACLMGTRRTDPFSENLQPFQMTDPDWPQVMRVSPILDWNYSDVWNYLLQMHVPYCTLYDMGYTSIGSSSNTEKNPALCKMVKGVKTYLPAFKLLDATKERSGRT